MQKLIHGDLVPGVDFDDLVPGVDSEGSSLHGQAPPFRLLLVKNGVQDSMTIPGNNCAHTRRRKCVLIRAKVQFLTMFAAVVVPVANPVPITSVLFRETPQTESVSRQAAAGIDNGVTKRVRSLAH